MVRLIELNRNVIETQTFRFQFHNGSINSILLAEALFDAKRFQFQNGSINSVKRRKPFRALTMFQFQNGSINSHP